MTTYQSKPPIATSQVEPDPVLYAIVGIWIESRPTQLTLTKPGYWALYHAASEEIEESFTATFRSERRP